MGGTFKTQNFKIPNMQLSFKDHIAKEKSSGSLYRKIISPKIFDRKAI
jgi:hypothetical protein